jgi:hypothetical protein
MPLKGGWQVFSLLALGSLGGTVWLQAGGFDGFVNDQVRPFINQVASDQLGMPVDIGQLQLRSTEQRLIVQLRNTRLNQESQLPQVSAEVPYNTLLSGGPKVSEVVLDSPNLVIPLDSPLYDLLEKGDPNQPPPLRNADIRITASRVWLEVQPGEWIHWRGGHVMFRDLYDTTDTFQVDVRGQLLMGGPTQTPTPLTTVNVQAQVGQEFLEPASKRQPGTPPLSATVDLSTVQLAALNRFLGEDAQLRGQLADVHLRVQEEGAAYRVRGRVQPAANARVTVPNALDPTPLPKVTINGLLEPGPTLERWQLRPLTVGVNDLDNLLVVRGTIVLPEDPAAEAVREAVPEAAEIQVAERPATTRPGLLDLNATLNPLPLNTLSPSLGGSVSAFTQVGGTFDAPQLQGRLNLSNVAWSYENQRILWGANGHVQFDQQHVVPELTGRLLQSPFHLSARYQLNTQRLTGRFNAPSMDVAQAVVVARPLSPQPLPPIDLKGQIGLAVPAFVAVLEPTPHIQQLAVNATVHNVSARSQNTPLVSQVNGRFRYQDQTVLADSITGQLNGQPFQVQGRYHLPSEKFQARLVANRFQLKALHPLVPVAAQLAGQPLPPEWQDIALQGNANVNLLAQGPVANPALSGQVVLNNAGAIYQPEDLGLTQFNGRIALAGQRITLQETRGLVGPVPVVARGYYVSPQQFDGRFSTELLPVAWLASQRPLIEKYLPDAPFVWDPAGWVFADGHATPKGWQARLVARQVGGEIEPVVVSEATGDLLLNGNYQGDVAIRLPDFRACVNGFPSETQANVTLRKWQLQDGHADLLAGLSGLWAQPRLNVLLQPGQTPPPLVASARVDVDPNHIELTRLQLLPPFEHALKVQGALNNPTNPETVNAWARWQHALNFAQIAPYINQDLFGAISGLTTADIAVTLTPETRLADGFFNLIDVAIPGLEIDEVDTRLDLLGQSGTLSVPTFQFVGASGAMEANIPDLFRFPVRLDQVAITGNQIQVEPVIRFIQEDLLAKFERQFVEEVARPWQPGDPVVPFEFRDARLFVDELIYQNIILDDVRGKLTVLPSSYFSLEDVSLTAAGGTVEGAFSMDPLANNFMSVRLYVDDVQANALARALLNLPNQIFGDLDGIILFTTEGQTEDDWVYNANGTANFNIQNGRIPAVARLETVLSGVNVIRGGLLGLNLNTLARALNVFETNYFAQLQADLQIARGNIFLKNFVSNSENLDLWASGRIDMATAYSDLVIRGALPQKTSGGGFGPFGRFSLSRLLGFVPVLGKTVSYIPGVGFVPGFGGPPGGYTRFEVTLEGPLGEPRAIQSVRWLPSEAP